MTLFLNPALLLRTDIQWFVFPCSWLHLVTSNRLLEMLPSLCNELLAPVTPFACIFTVPKIIGLIEKNKTENPLSKLPKKIGEGLPWWSGG